MGKNQHSKDRMFITSTEWSESYGGKKRKQVNETRPLPFDHCAMSLTGFSTPCILSNNTGVIFDFENIASYIQKHKSDPVTGDPMNSKDIIRLQMYKNNEGQWHCPVTSKVFNNNMHIVAIRSSGQVYSYSAVEELNIKAKNWIDLIDGSKFSKSDIITLQNPVDPVITAKRDISSFKHLQQIREDSVETKRLESKTRHSVASESVMKEISRIREEERESGTIKKTTNEILQGNAGTEFVDVARFQRFRPLSQDVTPGQAVTEGKVSASFTSSSGSRYTANEERLATVEEIRDARWRIMRKIDKKAYVQLQTSIGNLNLEIYTDTIMRTSWNFLALCKQGYYDKTKLHRLIPGFMIQGGDPTGTGRGGISAFQEPFRDEFDTRLSHDKKAAPHLDRKHSIFGRVVGGLSTLDRIEQIGSDKNEKPLQDIELITATVFSDPLEEADQLLEEFIVKNIELRHKKENLLSKSLPATLPEEAPPAKFA